VSRAGLCSQLTGSSLILRLDYAFVPFSCFLLGNAATEMGGGAANGVTQADGSNRPEPTFDVKQVGDAIVFMAGLPLGANAFNVTLT